MILEPMFKLSITYVEKDGTNLGDEAVTFGSQSEFSDMKRFPSHRIVVYCIDDRVPTNTSGNGLCDFLGVLFTHSVVRDGGNKKNMLA